MHDTLGIKELTDEQYEAIRSINGYTYETAPCIGQLSTQAHQKFRQFAGDVNPKFTPDAFDSARERLQMMDKREKQATMRAIAAIYASKCGHAFQADKNVNHAEFERMFNPRYAPKYRDALEAFGLPVRSTWSHKQFETLENLSRIALSKCNDMREAQFTFEEWYQLFWNYAMPFNALAYYCLTVTQSLVYTEEFVRELAGYMKHRRDTVGHSDGPILMVNCKLGKLAGLINATKILPVPVIAVHEEPQRNPYLLKIPPHCQQKFKLPPVEKLSMATGIEKYKPSMVLVSDLKTQQDITQQIRAHGCVKEYVVLGLQDSMVEGHGWDTWGVPKMREQDDKRVLAPHQGDGFVKYQLPHVSRWMLHRYDQSLAVGFSSAVSFHRAATVPVWTQRFKWWTTARVLARI